MQEMHLGRLVKLIWCTQGWGQGGLGTINPPLENEQLFFRRFFAIYSTMLIAFY